MNKISQKELQTESCKCMNTIAETIEVYPEIIGECLLTLKDSETSIITKKLKSIRRIKMQCTGCKKTWLDVSDFEYKLPFQRKDRN